MKTGAGQAINIAQARALLNAESFRCMQEVPVTKFTDGQTVEIVLPKSGIGQGVYLTFALTVDAAAGAVGAASGLGIAALINNIKLKDAGGVVRASLSGATLEALNKIMRWAYDETISTDTSVYDFAAPAAGTSEVWKYQLFLPFSVNDYSAVGAMPMTVSAGNIVLTIELNAVAGTTMFYPIKTADPTKYTINGTYGSIYATLQYLEPRNSQVLPWDDFKVYHELLEITDFSNLAASAEKRSILQTGRTVQRIIGYLTGGAVTEALDANVDRVAFLLNGATPIINMSYKAYAPYLHKKYGKRLPDGFFVWDFSDKPFSPNMYGELAVVLQLASAYTAAAGGRLVLMTESLYQVTGAAI